MTPFQTLTGIAAAVPIANIDTDQLAPARFLKTVSRSGLGEALLWSMRHDRRGSLREDFVLNREPWTRAQILIALDNFGCGSSREHAVWALGEFGIRAVIAPSFGDIFRGNCLENGLLPMRMPIGAIEELIVHASDPATACFTISLPDGTISAGKAIYAFAFDANEKDKLLRGADTLAESLSLMAQVERFERALPSDPIPAGVWRA